MNQPTTDSIRLPDVEFKDVLTELLRTGARQMLATAIEAEVAAWIEAHRDVVDNSGRREVVRNGHLPPRKLVTGVGNM